MVSGGFLREHLTYQVGKCQRLTTRKALDSSSGGTTNSDGYMWICFVINTVCGCEGGLPLQPVKRDIQIIYILLL